MVTIIDRTGEQQEVKYDQYTYAFSKKANAATLAKPASLILPLEAATWLFSVHNPMVHTTDGEFVRRYGVVDAPEDWVAEVGVDVLETSPLTRDTTRREGWDAEAMDPLRNKATVLDLRSTAFRERPGEYVNQGESGRVRS